MILFKYDGPEDPPKGMWKECHPLTAHIFKATVTCTNGHGLVLKSHSVDADGTVRPSVVCLHPGCDFHELITLNNWTQGVLNEYTK